MRKRPQFQLDAHVSEFIRDNDGPQHLLIVYYTGHGRYSEDKKCLDLAATNRPVHGKFSMDARANWNKAEDQLQHSDVESDVLTILDTCYSSNLVKASREQNKKFELLSACLIDQTTSSPGEYSFTRALIDAIAGDPAVPGDDGLLGKDDQPISTFSLNQKINTNPRRHDQPGGVWHRGNTIQPNDPHIVLVPLKPPKTNAIHELAYRPSPRGYLTLRFGLKEQSLKKEQIELLTKSLSRIVKTMDLKRIDWVDIRPAPPITHIQRVNLVLSVMRKWKKVIKSRKDEEEHRLSQRQGGFPESINVDSPSTSQKRGLDGGQEAPEAKRRYLDVGEPPSPPISNSSRMGDDA